MMIESVKYSDALTINEKLQLNPLPIQYLGSKGRIADWILKLAKKNFPNTTHFFDLFSGSGSTSISALNHSLIPVLNDIQPYSYVLLKSVFRSKENEIDELIALLSKNNNDKSLLSNGRRSAQNIFSEETDYFNDPNIVREWKVYKDFTVKTSVHLTNDEISKLRSLNEWNLFVKMYSNTYFGVRQCLEIDLIRELAESLNGTQKDTLLGTTISVLTQSVSGTTHLAQFLKISSEATAKNIIKKRKISIIDEVLNRLAVLREFKVPAEITVTNLDFIDALEAYDVDCKPNTVIYADPPYFKEHYSRYYHLLDTFYLYDYPNLTFNPRLNQATTGLYRENRIISKFGLKSKVDKAFHELFFTAKKNGLPVLLSYANTSLLKKEKLMEIAESNGYTGTLHTKELLHSGQGQKRNNIVTEYLFVFKLKID